MSRLPRNIFRPESNVLEIHLHEIAEYTDVIFIIESTVSHKLKQRKSLQFENVKNSNRFLKFRSKIVHFIIDDAEIEFADLVLKELYPGFSQDWAMEILQELLRWVKFLEWNSNTNFFGPDDIVGFGDADEIASRKNMFLLKNCRLQDYITHIDIGSTMVVGSVDRVFKSDFPVGGDKYPYTLGDPTFYRLSSAMVSFDIPSRKRGKSPHYLLGGIHMTEYEYIPYLLLKRLSCTECDLTHGGIKTIHDSLSSITSLIDLVEPMSIKSGFQGRFNTSHVVSEEIQDHYIVPWFLMCNQNRFPSWTNPTAIDTRIISTKKMFNFDC